MKPRSIKEKQKVHERKTPFTLVVSSLTVVHQCLVKNSWLCSNGITVRYVPLGPEQVVGRIRWYCNLMLRNPSSVWSGSPVRIRIGSSLHSQNTIFFTLEVIYAGFSEDEISSSSDKHIFCHGWWNKNGDTCLQSGYDGECNRAATIFDSDSIAVPSDRLSQRGTLTVQIADSDRIRIQSLLITF